MEGRKTARFMKEMSLERYMRMLSNFSNVLHPNESDTPLSFRKLN